MKFLVSILITALTAFALGLYFSWWTVALAAFLVGVLIYQPPVVSFLVGFLAVFLLWGGLAWMIDSANQSILSHKVASILPMGGSAFLLVLITALTGGITGGLGALTGSLLRRACQQDPTRPR